MRVYLAGPINGCNDDEANTWRDTVRKHAPPSWTLLDPMRRDYRGREHTHGREITALDRVDVGLCDVFLANCPNPSVGTSMEMLLAWQLCKLVVSVVPEGRYPSPWLVQHSHHVVRGLDSALGILANFQADIFLRKG